MADETQKLERIEIRISSEEKSLIKKCCLYKHLSISEFIGMVSANVAYDILKEASPLLVEGIKKPIIVNL